MISEKIINSCLSALTVIALTAGNAAADASVSMGEFQNGVFTAADTLGTGTYGMQINISNTSDCGKNYKLQLSEYNYGVLRGLTVRNIFLAGGLTFRSNIERLIDKDSAGMELKGELYDSDGGLICGESLKRTDGREVPKAADILELAAEKSAKKAHPRMVVDGQSGFDEIIRKIAEDSETAAWHQKIISDCDEVLTQEVCSYEDNDPLRILSANTVLNRLESLSYAYRITGEEKYLNRAAAEIENVLTWQDWNIYGEALNTSAICTGLSVAYDWLYDDLTEELKNSIRENIFDKAFSTLLNQYPNNGIGWMAADNNWSFVCNSGFAFTALTFFDEEGWYDNSAKILDYAAERLERTIGCIEDDGSWYEGTGYWSYGMQYLTRYLSALESAAGTDFGYGNIGAMEKTGLFPIYMTGYKNQFNLNDSSPVPVDAMAVSYFAGRYGNGTMFAFRELQLNNNLCSPTVYDVIWKKSPNDYQYDVIQDGYFAGKNQIAVFKSGGNALTAAEAAQTGERLQSAVMLHGGVNNVNHGHIDAGSFIYESQGVRWAIDSGAANYNLYNYFTGTNTGKDRWSYYKVRGESHNTVIVNPGLLADQKLDAEADITKFVSRENDGYAVVDMSKVLGLEQAQRGIYYNKLTGGVTVQDELMLQNPSEVYCMFNTDSEIQSISKDGKTVILSRDGKRLFIRLLSEGMKFVGQNPAQILPTSPNPDMWEENINSTNSANPKKQQVYGKKVFVHLTEAVGLQTVAMYIAPLTNAASDQPDGEIPSVTPISEWQ